MLKINRELGYFKVSGFSVDVWWGCALCVSGNNAVSKNVLLYLFLCLGCRWAHVNRYWFSLFELVKFGNDSTNTGRLSFHGHSRVILDHGPQTAFCATFVKNFFQVKDKHWGCWTTFFEVLLIQTNRKTKHCSSSSEFSLAVGSTFLKGTWIRFVVSFV